MTPVGPDTATSFDRVVDSLYVEAMLLADEARGYFENEARDDRAVLDHNIRVLLSCESLRVTTRLMHVIAWLLTRRAVSTGELTEAQAVVPSRRLASPPDRHEAPDPTLPAEAQRLLEATASLYRRAARLDQALAREQDADTAGGEPGNVDSAGDSPALAMQRRLAREL